MVLMAMNSRITIRSANASAVALGVHRQTGVWLGDRVVMVQVGDGMRAVHTLSSFARRYVRNV